MTNRPRVENIDETTVDGFGHEWVKFNQSARSESDLRATFEKYFAIFPWQELPDEAIGVDVGCGSGRWARFASERVSLVHCVDPSQEALGTAAKLLKGTRTTLACASAGSLPYTAETFDFAYTLGVLHHTPHPLIGLRDVVRVVRRKGPVLVYLYYALDNRPAWFRQVWAASDVLRRWLSNRSNKTRDRVSTVVAIAAYWPLSRTARVLESMGLPYQQVPLSAYARKPFYVLRTDALDRLGTPVEHRFTKEAVLGLMHNAGLTNVTVNSNPPYWCAVGRKI